jgi:hypothetical protein
MQPKFLDNPPRYTRTPRESGQPVKYACAVDKGPKPTGYPWLWWVCMALIAGATIMLVL